MNHDVDALMTARGDGRLARLADGALNPDRLADWTCQPMPAGAISSRQQCASGIALSCRGCWRTDADRDGAPPDRGSADDGTDANGCVLR